MSFEILELTQKNVFPNKYFRNIFREKLNSSGDMKFERTCLYKTHGKYRTIYQQTLTRMF